MKITDEMVQAAFAAYVSAKNKPTGWGETYGRWMRAALEAALAAAPQSKQEPVAWAQKAALDGVREYGEIIATLYADGYQPEQEWTEPLYTAPQPAPDDKLRDECERLKREIDDAYAALGPDSGWMDPPDGGSPTLAEMVAKANEDGRALYAVRKERDKLREAARIGLRALEELQGICTDSDGGVEAITVWTPEAVLALRAALGGN